MHPPRREQARARVHGGKAVRARGACEARHPRIPARGGRIARPRLAGRRRRKHLPLQGLLWRRRRAPGRRRRARARRRARRAARARAARAHLHAAGARAARALSRPRAPTWGKLMFCAKESFYKCYFPLSRTLLGFLDVEVEFERRRCAASGRGCCASRRRRSAGCVSFDGTPGLDASTSSSPASRLRVC